MIHSVYLQLPPIPDHRICISSSSTSTTVSTTVFCFLAILSSSSSASGADRFLSARTDGACAAWGVTSSKSESGEGARATALGGRLGIVGTVDGRVYGVDVESLICQHLDLSDGM